MSTGVMGPGRARVPARTLRQDRWWLAPLTTFIVFTAFEVGSFGAIIIAAKWVLDEVAGWTIFVGNLLATTAMLAYFFRRHRALARRLTDAWAEDA